jgi:hypothetical protein
LSSTSAGVIIWTFLNEFLKHHHLGEASADHIGHYLDTPSFVHGHGEIEPSSEHEGNGPTECESLQPRCSQNNQTKWILLRKPRVMSRRKGKIHHTPTIYLQSYEGKTCCSPLFRHVASEKEAWPREIDEIVSTLRSGRLEALNSLWVTHSTYTGVLPGWFPSSGISSAYRHCNSPLFQLGFRN